MRKITLILGGLALIVIINNLPPIRWFYGQNDCRYSNNNGTFTFAEVNFKGANYQLCQDIFREYKKQSGADTALFRLCPINPIHFWNYGEYLFSEKYRLPYKPWKEIEAKRKPIINKSGFQDF